MNLYQLFKASLMEPKKQAAVRIMTIGKIMRFVFLFILFMTVISFIELSLGLSDTTSDVDGLLQFVEEIEFLLYPFAFVFLFVSTTLYHFLKISFFALVGLLFIKMKKRKGEYRHLWRTTALAVTIPTLVSFAFSFIGADLWVSAGTSLLTVLYLYLATNYYPKQPVKKA
ncbi:DUF1189 family protein [Planococcus sp. NCCP-2050]|uniref:DUF1189 family protein n=1 Tax=Planococcus sp. NCCP-2050 TaxID=2944679 RepID=UPI00203DE4EA|nr:DUF1189 family protein [Planococcus sp. NCCP-2050]GKW44344.1 hypothetical protein NCCP2050_00360 [Planococcus sp. NCCP-2050]